MAGIAAGNTICPYCRKTIDISDAERDHVPPKALFPRPRPNNLVTVRCCRACHRQNSKGDEVLKVIAAMGLIRSRAVNAIRAEVDRALSRNPWWRSSLVRGALNAERVHVAIGSGEAIMHKIRISGEFAEALDQTVKRVAIGLLFDHDAAWDSSLHQFQIIQANEENPQQIIDVLREVGPLRFHKILGTRTFVAAWDFAKDSPESGIMIMSFFEGLNFVIFIKPVEAGKGQ